jgi:hypothetical protein
VPTSIVFVGLARVAHTVRSSAPIVAVSTFSSRSERSGWPTLMTIHPARREVLAREREELARGEVRTGCRAGGRRRRR